MRLAGQAEGAWGLGQDSLELRRGLADPLALCVLSEGLYMLHFESQHCTSELASLIQASGKTIPPVSGRKFAASGPHPRNAAFGVIRNGSPEWVRGLLYRLQAPGPLDTLAYSQIV